MISKNGKSLLKQLKIMPRLYTSPRLSDAIISPNAGGASAASSRRKSSGAAAASAASSSIFPLVMRRGDTLVNELQDAWDSAAQKASKGSNATAKSVMTKVFGDLKDQLFSELRSRVSSATTVAIDDEEETLDRDLARRADRVDKEAAKLGLEVAAMREKARSTVPAGVKSKLQERLVKLTSAVTAPVVVDEDDGGDVLLPSSGKKRGRPEKRRHTIEGLGMGLPKVTGAEAATRFAILSDEAVDSLAAVKKLKDKDITEATRNVEGTVTALKVDSRKK